VTARTAQKSKEQTDAEVGGDEEAPAPAAKGNFGVGQDESTSEGTGTVSEELSDVDQAAQANTVKAADVEVAIPQASGLVSQRQA